MTMCKKLVLGTMQFGWTVSKREAIKILDEYFELGGRQIDTANTYGSRVGEVESLIGEWMRKKKNRGEITLITKVRGRAWSGEDGEGLGLRHVKRSCNDSLKRLKTDFVNYYIAHWPDDQTTLIETVSAFKSLQVDGRIKMIGCSNYSTIELEEFSHNAKKQEAHLQLVEANYNILERNTVQSKLLPVLNKNKIKLFSYGSLCGGLLSDQYKQISSANPRKKFLDDKKNAYSEELSKLEVTSKEYGMTISQLSLSWLISQPHVSGVIFGVDNAAQLKSNFKKLKVISPIEYQETSNYHARPFGI